MSRAARFDKHSVFPFAALRYHSAYLQQSRMWSFAPLRLCHISSSKAKPERLLRLCRTGKAAKKSKVAKGTGLRPSILETLFWEIKNRFFYIFLSFFLSFFVCYGHSRGLLYIFFLSYGYASTPSSFLELCSTGKASGAKLQITELLTTAKQLSTTGKAFWSFAPHAKPQLNEKAKHDLNNWLLVYENQKIEDSAIAFIFTDLEEAFSTIVLLCLMFSLLTVIPICVYQSRAFFSSSNFAYESRRSIYWLFSVSCLWFFFAYAMQYFIIPRAAQFLLFFEVSNEAFSLSAETKIASYCSWVSNIWIVSNFLFFSLIFLFFKNLSGIMQKAGFSYWLPYPGGNLPGKGKKAIAYGVAYQKAMAHWAKDPNLSKELYRAAKGAPPEKEIKRCKGEILHVNIVKNGDATHKIDWSFLQQQSSCQPQALPFKEKRPISRKRTMVVSVLIAAFIAPPEWIWLFLSLFFFCGFELAIYSWRIAESFIIKKSRLL